MTFENRVAIVTGSGAKRGIGRAIAEYLASYGCDIVSADINLESAKETADVVSSMGRKAVAVQVDVTDPESVKNMVRAGIESMGKIDILINNAGITQPRTVLETTLEDWNRVIGINLTGTFLCSQAVLAHMKENGYGRIVNMSSVSGKRGGGVFGGAHYSAAKAGILGFSKALARECVEQGVTVNCICPGAVGTDIRKGLAEEKERAIGESIPIKRVATTREIAYVAAFLASEEASYITGEDVDINGGSHMD